jgi:hypothetical protein
MKELENPQNQHMAFKFNALPKSAQNRAENASFRHQSSDIG